MGRFVFAEACNTRKAEGKAGQILRAPLNFVVSYFHDDFRPDRDRVAIILDFQCPQLRRHLYELLIRQTLEGFAHRRETAGFIDNGQMVIGEPAAAPPRTAVRRYNHAIDRHCRFHLKPSLTAVSRQIRTCRIFRHDPLVPFRQSLLEKGFGRIFFSGNCSLRKISACRQSRQFQPSFVIRLVDKRLVVDEKTIEQIKRKRDFFSERFDLMNSAKSAHEILKRQRPAMASDRNDFAIENKGLPFQTTGDSNYFRQACSHFGKPAAPNSNKITPFVNLNPGAIVLELKRGFSSMGSKNFREVFCQLG